MEKYAVLSAVSRGSFWERLCHLYMKTGDYVDMENLENRHAIYARVFLSDIRNQYATLLESQLWQDYLSQIPCSVIGMAPLDGSKISVLLCTSDSDGGNALCRVRLSQDDISGKDVYAQAVMLFEKFVSHAHLAEDAAMPSAVRLWIYVDGMDRCHAAVEKAFDDVLGRYGIHIEPERVAVTCIEGSTHVEGVAVALDYVAFLKPAKVVVPVQIGDGCVPAYGNRSACIGVGACDGLRVYPSAFGVADGAGTDSGQLDVRQYTGLMLGNVGVSLKRYGLTMNDVKCFVAYLRDLSDYTDVERLLSTAFPYTPHAIVRACGADSSHTVMIECVANK